MSVQSLVVLSLEHATRTIEKCLPLWQVLVKRLSATKLTYPNSNEHDVVW